MIKKYLLSFFAISMVMGFVLIPATHGLAVDPQFEFNKSLKESGITTPQTVESVIQQVINAILGFIGVIAFIIVIYAGGLWLTAGGKEDNVKKAKEYLWGALLGIVIVFSAFVIVNFVIGALQGSSS